MIIQGMKMELPHKRCVARTTDIAEADRLAESYQLQGYDVEVIKREQGGVSVFEVWVSREPDIKS